MKTKELIEALRGVGQRAIIDKPDKDYRVLEEVIQHLREYDELKKVFTDAIDPLMEITAYLLAISNFQDGDINYGRKE